ncbi:MAG: hypothetical protein E7539_05990 [Ruminococcaceae bacterium]|nr:hypothetical protein [Oscillospiraceae bacterium]
MQENNTLNIEDLTQDTDICSDAEGTPKAAENEEIYRVFKTKEEFQQCIDKALGKRLSKARQQSQELEEMKETLNGVFEKLGVESVSQLVELASLKNMQQNSSEADDASLAEALSSELEKLAETEGGFYGTEQAKGLLADKRLISLVKNGFAVKDAVDALNMPALLEAQAQEEREQVIREIRLRGLRPQEDAVSGYGSFSMTLDPKNLSDAQRADIKERVRRGERITF